MFAAPPVRSIVRLTVAQLALASASISWAQGPTSTVADPASKAAPTAVQTRDPMSSYEFGSNIF